jgi:hypothetical protein
MCKSCGCKTAKSDSGVLVGVDPKMAFNHAITMGTLSANKSDANYAGKWMYMYEKEGQYWFKNIDTRTYIGVKQ